MLTIGLIKEGKWPADNRVALTPAQCRWMRKHVPDIRVVVQSSPHRCFADIDYKNAGIEVKNDISECDILFGIKEVPVELLIPGRTYLFFSHTKKLQPHNKQLFQTILDKKITLIDYECLEYEDGQRIIGFGFFAGIVGAHNGMMAYGNRTGAFKLGRVYENKDYRHLIHTYFGLKLPKIKIAIAGGGRVAQGVLDIMNLMGILEVDPNEYLQRSFPYPVYTQLKGADLYRHKKNKTYDRDDFHFHPEQYSCRFLPYCTCTDILMNAVYWEKNMPRLFELKNVSELFAIKTIADISDDENGAVPLNFGDRPMEDPIYGINKLTKEITAPYLADSIDIMAVGNLPNELPCDASRYFGEQLIKHVLEDMVKGGSPIIDNATIVKKGTITKRFEYMEEYGAH